VRPSPHINVTAARPMAFIGDENASCAPAQRNREHHRVQPIIDIPIPFWGWGNWLAQAGWEYAPWRLSRRGSTEGASNRCCP